MTTQAEAVKVLRDALTGLLESLHDYEGPNIDKCKAALAATSQVEAETAEAVAWLLEDQGCRAPDDCEEFERVVLAKDILPDELARFVKAGRAHALYAAPLALPATEQIIGMRASQIGVTTTLDLAMLVKRMGRALSKAAPENKLSSEAMDYLQRKGLQGSPLRTLGERMAEANAPKPFPPKKGS